MSVQDPIEPESSRHVPTFSYPAQPPVGQGPETVVNPERRPIGLAAESASGSVGSSVLNRLFPPVVQAADAPMVSSPEGLTLGHFAVEQCIGRGGMGAVFRATDTRLQRTVALKVLSPTLSRDPSAVQRFENEARAAARLDHDHIARVFYIGEDKGLHFIAFEFVTGTNIRDLILRQGRFSPEDVVNYALQIASALRHTSAADVVHRDVKPSNIIVTPSGRAKLVDLGLARKARSESGVELTLAGTTLGTFDYISPEQAKDPRTVDVRSDIYSLGCTLYHMLTGEPPYPEGTVLQKLLDHQGKEAPDPSLKNRRVSPDLAAIVRKMMASDPAQRYSTPDQLIHDLMLVAGVMGLRGVSPEGLIWMSARRPDTRFWERNIGWIVTAGLLILIVVVLEQFGQQLEQRLGERLGRADSKSKLTQSATDTELATDLPKHTGMESSPPSPANTLPDGNATSPSTTVSKDQSVSANSSNNDDQESTAVNSRETATSPDSTAVSSDVADTSTQTNAKTNNTGGTTSPMTSSTGSENTTTIASTQGTLFDTSNTTQETSPSASNDRISDPIAYYTIISVDGVRGKSYRSLEAACSEAMDGGRIELQFNGVRREAPLRITNKALTLRGAEGFEPEIEFVPSDVPGEGIQRQMMTVTDGSIHLINVRLSLHIPEDLRAERFALFSLEAPQSVRMQSVLVTIENLGNQSAVVAELIPGSDSALSDMPILPDEFTHGTPQIEITDSVFRGIADFLLVAQTTPARISIRNSAVMLDGSLLQSRGTADSMTEDDDQLEMQLEHVTCLLSGSLIDLDTGSSPRQVAPVSVVSRNCVYALDGDRPFISMQGESGSDTYRKLLQWKGERNFYDAIEEFWAIGQQDEPLDFKSWQLAWGPAYEVGARNDDIAWMQPWRHIGFSNMTLLDLELAQNLENPVVAGATDGADAGADLTTLPITPPTTSLETPSIPEINEPDIHEPDSL